jgi:hypothetical protein
LSLLTVPDPPKTLSNNITLTNNTRVAFTWTAPVNNGGSPVTGYKIYWNAGITGGPMEVINANFIEGTSFTV